jgi:hypothetical protein
VEQFCIDVYRVEERSGVQAGVAGESNQFRDEERCRKQHLRWGIQRDN